MSFDTSTSEKQAGKREKADWREETNNACSLLFPTKKKKKKSKQMNHAIFYSLCCHLGIYFHSHMGILTMVFNLFKNPVFIYLYISSLLPSSQVHRPSSALHLLSLPPFNFYYLHSFYYVSPIAFAHSMNIIVTHSVLIEIRFWRWHCMPAELPGKQAAVTNDNEYGLKETCASRWNWECAIAYKI